MNGIDTKEPLLTISIPTYNRIEQIQKQVRNLLPQLNSLTILVVYDNCSPIPVKSLFTNEELKQFIIKENRMNVGGDANIARCFEMCNTQWLWTLSDDDFITDTAVSEILHILRKKENSIFLNFDTDINKETTGFDDFCKTFKKGRIYSNSYWISKCVYNIKLLKPYIYIYYQNLSSVIGQLIIILKCLEENKKYNCHFYKTKIIAKSPTNPSWSYSMYIYRTAQILDTLKKNKTTNSTLFKSMIQVYFYMLRNSNHTINKKIKLLSYIVYRFGFSNIIRYNSKHLIATIIKIICPKIMYKLNKSINE